MRLTFWLRKRRPPATDLADRTVESATAPAEVVEQALLNGEKPESITELRDRVFKLQYDVGQSIKEDARLNGEIERLRDSIRGVNAFHGKVSAALWVGVPLISFFIYFMAKDVSTMLKMAHEYEACHKQQSDGTSQWICDHGLVLTNEQRAQIKEVIDGHPAREPSAAGKKPPGG